jgi:lipopolysaccharide transport system permease protein
MLQQILSPRIHLTAVRELLAILTRHRQLTFEMARREISDRYLGQVFGTFWAIGHPLSLMIIYVFIFGHVLKIRIGGTYELPRDFTTYLLSGLIPWLCFQESIAKGVGAIFADAHLVKQVVFPIEILPVKGVLASMVTMAITLTILVGYVLVTQHGVPLTYALLPALMGFQFLAMVGVCFILASVGVYFRDLKDFVQVFCFAGIYLVPIIYLPVMVPTTLRPLLYINPFSYMVWCYQDALYFGRFEHWWAWVVFAAMSLGIFYFGYRVFRKLKIMFGDVL